MENNKVLDFIEFFKTHTHLQSKDALKIYDKEFDPKKVPEYFENWEYWESDGFKRGGVYLRNKKLDGHQSTLFFADENYYCTETECIVLFNPTNFGQFISDTLRDKNFELLFTKKAMNIIYG